MTEHRHHLESRVKFALGVHSGLFGALETLPAGGKLLVSHAYLASPECIQLLEKGWIRIEFDWERNLGTLPCYPPREKVVVEKVARTRRKKKDAIPERLAEEVDVLEPPPSGEALG